MVVAPAGDGSSMAITETGLVNQRCREESELFWKGAIARLEALVRGVRARRESPRQAIVIIHGIGEQRPGRTLRDFVRAGIVQDGDEQWVKPDRISGSFELRRVTIKAAGRRTPTTDIFELYWAHIIRDTTLAQVGGWIRRLLLRRKVPDPLRPAMTVLRAVVLAAIAAIVARLFWDVPWLSAGGLAVVAAGVVWKVVGRTTMLDVVGDAARYLSPEPGNVAHRQAIRQAGVDLIETLHRRGEHDRVVILGHSLGSVIAYDIVTHAWIRMSGTHESPQNPSFKAVRAVEKAVTTVTDVDAAQLLQHDAWREQRCNTQPWLVTDLVTVGSPLTYADFLMASKATEFAEAKRDRVLPTCPPVTEIEAKTKHARISFESSYPQGLGSRKNLTFTEFHHAAPFAVTRWTNLYFKTRLLGVVGDLVGGPVAPQFGPWVKDVPLTSPVNGFAHTCYWRVFKKTRAHLDALRDAIAPAAGQELLELGKSMPAAMLVEPEAPDTTA
jgi:hypothetical protein